MRLLLAPDTLAAPFHVANPGTAAAVPCDAPATGQRDSSVSALPGRGRFPLVAGGRAAPLVVSAGGHAGGIRVADDLSAGPAPAYDVGDHLPLNRAGYQAPVAAVPEKWFRWPT